MCGFMPGPPPIGGPAPIMPLIGGPPIIEGPPIIGPSDWALGGAVGGPHGAPMPPGGGMGGPIGGLTLIMEPIVVGALPGGPIG